MCLPQLEYLGKVFGETSVTSDVETKIRKKKKGGFPHCLRTFNSRVETLVCVILEI